MYPFTRWWFIIFSWLSVTKILSGCKMTLWFYWVFDALSFTTDAEVAWNVIQMNFVTVSRIYFDQIPLKFFIKSIFLFKWIGTRKKYFCKRHILCSEKEKKQLMHIIWNILKWINRQIHHHLFNDGFCGFIVKHCKCIWLNFMAKSLKIGKKS